MKKLRSMPQLITQIVEIIDAWSSNRNPVYIEEDSPYSEYTKIAFDVQKEIGFQSFIVGLVAHEWGEAQDVYYRKEIKELKYNTIRWKQGLIEALLNYATAQWKERCDLIHAENSATHDQRFRAMLKIKLRYLREHKSMLHQSDFFLLQKTDAFFEKCDKANLEMWYIRVKIAVDKQNENMKRDVGDITKYVKVRKRKQRNYKPTQQPEPKSYKQLTLFSKQKRQVIREKITPAQISQEEQQNIDLRRSQLKNVLRKRKEKQSRVTEHTFVRKKKKITRNQTSVNNIQPQNVSTKKRLSPKAIYTTLRKRMRKEGKELKNDR